MDRGGARAQQLYRSLTKTGRLWYVASVKGRTGPTQMFQLFLRSRAQNFIKARLGIDEGFRARSPERDAETDRLRVKSILAAIDDALQAAESEQSGLSRRV